MATSKAFSRLLRRKKDKLSVASDQLPVERKTFALHFTDNWQLAAGNLFKNDKVHWFPRRYRRAHFLVRQIIGPSLHLVRCQSSVVSCGQFAFNNRLMTTDQGPINDDR